MAKKKRPLLVRHANWAHDYDLFTTKLSYKDINPQLVKATAISDKTLKEEYTRLRDIAQKRIKRMEGRPEAAGTLANLPEGGFPKLRGMSREDIVQNLMDISNFLVAPRGSLSGIQRSNKKIQASLAKKGLDIPTDQLTNFGNFMTALKKALGAERGSEVSEQILRFYRDSIIKGKVSKTGLMKRINEIMAEQEAKGAKYSRAQRKAKNRFIRSEKWQEWFDFDEEE